ncbi:hypothetical protein Q8A73_017522 [Channa argus]|nr:hypothetical protein Q8A73_017522 [Channa argus]
MFQVVAEVCSWDLPPLPERYKKACQSLAVDENKRVTRFCEVQDGSSTVSLCGLSLAPSSLNPLRRALKLQSSITELRTCHLRSVCLSHNAMGSTGFELVLKTLPLHIWTCLLSAGVLGDCSLTHLSLAANGLTDSSVATLASMTSQPPDLAQRGWPTFDPSKPSRQGDCSLTHLSLAANGLTDRSVATLARLSGDRPLGQCRCGWFVGASQGSSSLLSGTQQA